MSAAVLESQPAQAPEAAHAPPVSRLERLVDEASPLSDDQRERLAVITGGGRR